jgi:hypothetical protein
MHTCTTPHAVGLVISQCLCCVGDRCLAAHRRGSSCQALGKGEESEGAAGAARVGSSRSRRGGHMCGNMIYGCMYLCMCVYVCVLCMYVCIHACVHVYMLTTLTACFACAAQFCACSLGMRVSACAVVLSDVSVSELPELSVDAMCLFVVLCVCTQALHACVLRCIRNLCGCVRDACTGICADAHVCLQVRMSVRTNMQGHTRTLICHLAENKHALHAQGAELSEEHAQEEVPEAERAEASEDVAAALRPRHARQHASTEEARTRIPPDMDSSGGFGPRRSSSSSSRALAAQLVPHRAGVIRPSSAPSQRRPATPHRLVPLDLAREQGRRHGEDRRRPATAATARVDSRGRMRALERYACAYWLL